MENCPCCKSDDIIYVKKKLLWICQACGTEFKEVVSAESQRLTDKAPNPKAIFFSYGHDANRELVKMFKTDLEKRGHKVWFDQDPKAIGTWDDWKGAIARGIDSSEMAIVFMSKHALRDPGVCRNEIAISLNRFGNIYPVAVEEDIYDDTPVTIRHLQWPDLSQWRSIKDGQVLGEDWDRWYEARLIELINKIEGEASQFAGESHALREVLRPASFESKVAQHIPGFIGREWIFAAYHHWLENQPESRLFWIKAGPGVGKTALAANLAARERGAIVASWFCDAKSSELKRPEQAIRSLAFQWALRWDDYRVRLMRNLGIAAGTPDDRLDEVAKELNKQAPQDLFRTLITEPLANLIWREHKLVVVIDALDEATDDEGNNPLTDFLATQLASLPAWIGFVVTSRPDPAVITRLQGFKPFEINAQDSRNLADLRTWYREHLGKREELTSLPTEQQQHIENCLIERSEGMILYLKLVEEGLKEQSLNVSDLDKLEAGLPGLYRNYAISFQHRFGKDYETKAQPLLRLLVAAEGPLPEDLAGEVLGLNNEQFNQMKIRLGSFVIESPAGLELFHKTLKEWLIHKADNVFYVDHAKGQQQIGDVLFREVKEKDRHEIRWCSLIRQWLVHCYHSLAQQSDSDALIALGDLLLDWGDDSRAEPLYREALAIRQATLARGHPDIAVSLNKLAHLYTTNGRYEEAEPLCHEALIFSTASLESGHPNIATALNYLAGLLSDTERYDEAEPLYREALAIWKAALKPDHPDIARGLSNLASLLYATERYDEVEPLCREALAIWKATLKPDHPDIAKGLNNLASLLYATERYDEAEPLCREALAIWKATLKPDHPDIATGLNSLAELLESTGRYDEAELLYREALAIRKAALRPDHPAIATGLETLANLLQSTGRYDEAEPLCREALTIWKAALKPGDPDIVFALNNLAYMLKACGRYDEVEPLYREALAILQAALPAGHPSIATSLNNLAALLKDTGRHDEAEPLFREALVISPSGSE